MSLELIRRWVSKLPPYELDNPIVILDGYAYTPRLILYEVERGSPIGERLQRMVEIRSFGTTYEEETALMKLRLRMALEKLEERPIIARLDGFTLTPRELLREIENETEIGRQWIENEKRFVQRLLSVR